MKTIILPGYSPHNKDWAEKVAKNLKTRTKDEIVVHNWQHWQSGSFSIKRELKKIGQEMGDGKVNIIAKSVGTRVVVSLLTSLPNRINKLILCGIPTVSEDAKKIYSEGLSKIDNSKIVCFQNTKDPFATADEVREFIGSVNKKIKVVEKPRSDHDYSYFEDFVKFFKA